MASIHLFISNFKGHKRKFLKFADKTLFLVNSTSFFWGETSFKNLCKKYQLFEKTKHWTCWQGLPFVSCIGVRGQKWWHAFQLGTFSSTMGTGDKSSCKLCGSGCVRLSARLSCGWRDCRTGGTRNRVGGPPQFANYLLTSGSLGGRWAETFRHGSVFSRGVIIVFPLGCGNPTTLWVSSHTLCGRDVNCPLYLMCFPLYEKQKQQNENCACERQRMLKREGKARRQ